MKAQDFHFEQPTTSDHTEQKTATRIRNESIAKKFSGKTDRQLLEEQVHLNQLRNDHIKSIKNNVQFFFWLTLISLGVWVIISVASDLN